LSISRAISIPDVLLLLGIRYHSLYISLTAIPLIFDAKLGTAGLAIAFHA